MAIVITNGTHYIKFSNTGGIKYTEDISEAFTFSSVSEAISKMREAPSKTRDYMVTDTLTNHVLWKWMSREEIIQKQEEKKSQLEAKRDKAGKIARRVYSQDTRKLLYINAGGRCELCGKKILFEDMTIDHVIPLSMGGADKVENLACVCYTDNQFKSNILPEDFIERVTQIFLYQMEKKHQKSLRWKIMSRTLKAMI